MVEENARRSRIEARIKEPRAHLAEIESSLDQALDPNLEDRAIDLKEDEVLESMGHANLRELRLLEEALKRMARGEYGICKRCGRSISEARRRAVLYAVLGHRRSRCGERRSDGGRAI
ncbi:MAG: TraR/DksA family transcriptional regulator [Limimaricola soesokkakensis]|uniref:TraR/DksA family transcriptional regulator n=1 Tax=Limimaricola soesokkakensis TaxID=1343159 RepID=UPI004057D23C